MTTASNADVRGSEVRLVGWADALGLVVVVELLLIIVANGGVALALLCLGVELETIRTGEALAGGLVAVRVGRAVGQHLLADVGTGIEVEALLTLDALALLDAEELLAGAVLAGARNHVPVLGQVAALALLAVVEGLFGRALAAVGSGIVLRGSQTGHDALAQLRTEDLSAVTNDTLVVLGIVEGAARTVHTTTLADNGSVNGAELTIFLYFIINH